MRETEQLLTEGRVLANLIKAQTRKCELALNNNQEFNRLSTLKAEWQAFERTARELGIDVDEEFGDSLRTLRPVQINTIPTNQRRPLGVFELAAIGSRQTKKQKMSLDEEGVCQGVPRGC
jgi:hypothetical protein